MFNPVEQIEIVKTCVLCKTGHNIIVNRKDAYDWKNGKLIQDAFPYLDVDQREILISGICGKCFDAEIGGDE